MTQRERDASIRLLRDRLMLANGDIVAAITELRGHQATCRAVSDLIDGCVRDATLRAAPPELPGDLPSSDRIRYLFAELRTHTATVDECKTLLRQAGYGEGLA